MKASTAILIAVLVVIVALIIYAVAKDPSWAHKSYWLANFVESPWQVYRRSDGTFDSAAQLALRRATGRQNPSAADHFLSAVILTRNVIGQEHRPEIDPRTGAPTRAARDQARQRRGMYDQARHHYMAAVAGLRQPAAREPARARTEPANEGRIIDAALEFAVGGFADLLANDRLLAAMIAEGDVPVGYPPELGQYFVDYPLMAAATTRRKDVLAERRRVAQEAADEQGGARGAALNTYVELATEHTDDPQNTHDPGVLACLRAMVARLRADQGDLAALPTVGDVVAGLHAGGAAYSEGRPHLVKDAVEAAGRTLRGERVVAIDATDEECLRRVWARAADPRNAATAGKMRQSLFDNLVDCWETDIVGARKIVCVNGRASRILSTLVLLDWDKRNWTVKKVEQFKNDIYSRAHEMITAAARRAAESDDPDTRKAGRLYAATTLSEVREIGDVPEAASARLAGAMRDEVVGMVDAYIADLEHEVGLKGAIPDYLVDSIKEDVKAAVAA